MVCRAEIFKFLVNQELCSLFNTLLIVLSRKDSAPFEHALNMFHSSASLYLTGRRMPTPQPTRWVAQPPLGAAWGQERLAAGAQLAPRWSGHSTICSGQGMVGTGLGRVELAPHQAVPSAATGCLLWCLASIYCCAPLTFKLALIRDLQD